MLVLEYLDSVARRYQSEALVQRLQYARHGTDSQVAARTYQLLLEHARQQGNTRRYLDLKQQQQQPTMDPNNYSDNDNNPDDAWMSSADARNRHDLGVLQSRLTSAQAHLSKDAIRNAYLSLAEFYESRLGQLAEAASMLQQAKDYCTQRSHTHVVLLATLQVALSMRHLTMIRDCLQKLQYHAGRTTTTSTAATANSSTTGGTRGSSERESPPASDAPNSKTVSHPTHDEIAGKVAMASGLLALMTYDYSAAHHHFVQASRQATSSWPQVLCLEEVLLYAHVLTLVFGSPSDMLPLAQQVDDGEAAWAMTPTTRHVQECFLDFSSRHDHGTCWRTFQRHVVPNLQVDVYLGPHLLELQRRFRERSILYCWRPLCRVQLDTMVDELGASLVLLGGEDDDTTTTATAAGTTHHTAAAAQNTLQQLLVDLIRSGKMVDTRMNLLDGTLDRQVVADTLVQATRAKLAATSDQVIQDSYSMVVRLACLEQKLVIGAGGGSSNRYASTNKRANRAANLQADPIIMNSSDDEEGKYQEDDDDDDDHSDEGLDVPMVDVDADDMNPEDLY
jgi:hypothetical protein